MLEVQVGKAEPRLIPLTITAGVQTSQYIEPQESISLPPPPAEKTRKR